MNPKSEPCSICFEPNFLYDLSPYCANCMIDYEERHYHINVRTAA